MWNTHVTTSKRNQLSVDQIAIEIELITASAQDIYKCDKGTIRRVQTALFYISFVSIAHSHLFRYVYKCKEAKYVTYHSSGGVISLLMAHAL